MICKRCNVTTHDGRACPKRKSNQHCGDCGAPDHRGRDRCPKWQAGRAAQQEKAAPPPADRFPLSAYRALGQRDGKHGPDKGYVALPERMGPAHLGAYSEGYVDGSGEIPPHLRPWKLFPVEGEREAEAYERARDTRQTRN